MRTEYLSRLFRQIYPPRSRKSLFFAAVRVRAVLAELVRLLLDVAALRAACPRVRDAWSPLPEPPSLPPP
jgi:hypothetical protein